MAIESDRAEPLSGIRQGASTGGPIALLIPNKDWENWQRTMYSEPEMPPEAAGADRPAVTRPRPGHADLAGFMKYGHEDLRNVLERASARETAARVAVGAIARQLLRAVGTQIASHVTAIGSAAVASPSRFSFEAISRISADAPLHCADSAVEQQMIAEIDRARDAGDTHVPSELANYEARSRAGKERLRVLQDARTAELQDCGIAGLPDGRTAGLQEGE